VSGGSSDLWSPPFRKLFAAQVVSVFGDALVPVALAIGALDQTGGRRCSALWSRPVRSRSCCSC
jgi:hypothetical protein